MSKKRRTWLKIEEKLQIIVCAGRRTSFGFCAHKTKPLRLTHTDGNAFFYNL